MKVTSYHPFGAQSLEVTSNFFFGKSVIPFDQVSEVTNSAPIDEDKKNLSDIKEKGKR